MAKKTTTMTDKREVAEQLFYTGYTQKDIATKIAVSEKTVSAWARAGAWKDRRNSILLSKNNRLAELHKELKLINQTVADSSNGFADSKLANTRRWLVKDIKDLESEYNIAEMLGIGHDFIGFVKEVDKDVAEQIYKLYDGFINQQIERKKWQN